ncbi:MAG: rod shape-determining protein MreC [Gammaproteobacteria bacterium HGW-Gammaproteobacteria-10]|nr:MAG: rod shape-determining protein MreC [Gammaproteobacteria bacterium HGW-Gammaproteobacteria-10]HBA65063.1 rod shape-determining protein MreC [Methylococcaceae bacterium]
MVINPLFATGPSINTRLLVAVLASIALLVAERKSSQLDKLRSVLSMITYPIQSITDWPLHHSKETVESIKSLYSLKKENEQLRQEQLIYKSQLLKYEALEQENIRLRALLEKSFKLGEQVLVAELLSVNLAPFEHVVVVDKGTRFGVHAQQAVMDAYGVVGQVYRALPLSSEIMLITDPGHAIPVQINRNGLRTIAVGSGQINRLILPYLANNADIEEGDLLISSGLGGIFPQGYPVAVVEKIIPQPNKPFAEIYATPKAQLNRSRELLIVWKSEATIPLETQETEQADENHAEE